MGSFSFSLSLWWERVAPLRRLKARCADADLRWAIAAHRCAGHRGVLPALLATSRLGDGVLWYGLMFALPLLDGRDGLRCAVQMFFVGAINVALYATVKRRIGRPRPFVACADIRACTRALDRFSFPSGHALHAVAYAVLLSHHYPVLAAPVWTFAALVAASRVVLGLHYPSDVLAGVLTGLATGGGMLLLWRLWSV